MRLLGLGYKSDNIIKSKAMKFIAKKILPDHRQHWKPIESVVKRSSCEQKFLCQKTKQNRLMLLSNCTIFCKKKLTFIKNKELHNFKIFEMISLK